MQKKSAKVFGLVLILSASLCSFVYMNSASLNLDISEGVSFEQSEILPEEHSITTPAITIAKKAVFIAKCFLYPTE